MDKKIRTLKNLLLVRAYTEHGTEITPPCKCKTWEDSFIIEGNVLYLWYNSPDGSTHIKMEKIDE